MMLAADGKGKVAALKLWECETILNLGWRESSWIRLTLDERYRKLIAYKLPGWMQALEAEEEAKRIRAKSGKPG